MRIGSLRHRVQILKPTQTTDDEQNITRDWELAATIWANMKQPSGEITLEEGGFTETTVTRTMECRPNPEVQEKRRIEWKGKSYDIVTLDDTASDKYVLTLRGISKMTDNRKEVIPDED